MRRAEACLSAASSDISPQDRIKKIKQARKHLALATLSFADCDMEEEMEPAVQRLEKRIKEAESSAASSEQGMSALSKAEQALGQERWDDVEAACARALEAFEAAGEIGQIFVIEELQKRAGVAKVKAGHRQGGEKAGKAAREALTKGLLQQASDHAKVAKQEYAKSGFSIPKPLLALFEDIETAHNNVQKQAWINEGDQAVAQAESCIASQAVGDAAVALAKAQDAYTKAGALPVKEALLSKLEQCIREIEDKRSAKSKGLQLLAEAEIMYSRSAEMHDKEKASVLSEASTLAINAWSALNQAGAADSDVQAAAALKTRIQDERERLAARMRCVEALDSAESSLQGGKIEAAKLQIEQARAELEMSGRGPDLVARLGDAERRIQAGTQAQDVKRRVSEALEAARTALELSQLPGRRDKVAHARIHANTAREALGEASREDREELAENVQGMLDRVSEAEKWAAGCEEGDRLVALARESMEEGSLDEAAGHCRAAIAAYTRASAADLLREAQQLSKQVENAQLCADGASEMDDAAAALQEDDHDEAFKACARARTYYERAGALDQVHRVDVFEQRIQQARAQRAAEVQGRRQLAEAREALARGDTQAAQSQLDLSKAAFAEAGSDMTQAFEASFREIEAELEEARGNAQRNKKAEELLHSAETALVRGDVVTARFDVSQAKDCARDLALISIADTLLARIIAIESALQGREHGERILNAAERAIGACSYAEAVSLLQECRQAFTQAGMMADMEARVASLEAMAREGVHQDAARKEAVQAMREAEAALEFGELDRAKTLAVRALVLLEKFEAPIAEIAIAKDVLQRVDAAIDTKTAKERVLAALDAAERLVAEEKFEAAKAQASMARSEIHKAFDESSDTAQQLKALEERIDKSMHAQDVKKRVSEALEAARTALELSQLPGRRDKVAHARIHANTAREALGELAESATADIDTETVDWHHRSLRDVLERDMHDTEERVREAERWVIGCEEGDRLVALARESMEEGSLDEAAGYCRAAIAAYTGS